MKIKLIHYFKSLEINWKQNLRGYWNAFCRKSEWCPTHSVMKNWHVKEILVFLWKPVYKIILLLCAWLSCHSGSPHADEPFWKENHVVTVQQSHCGVSLGMPLRDQLRFGYIPYCCNYLSSVEVMWEIGWLRTNLTIEGISYKHSHTHTEEYI